MTDAGLRDCDLILRGGITSGVVYPGAITTLARHWRFRNIGGASAGAIGAAMTAAAEYGRQSGRQPAAFADILAVIPAELGEKDRSGRTRLERLFAPAAAVRPLFRAALALQQGRAPWALLPLALPGLVGGLLLAFLLTSLLRLLWVPAADFAQFDPAWAVATLALALPLALPFLLHTVRQQLATLRMLGYGLVPGASGGDGEEHLSDWLHARIQHAAGLPADEPLTVGHLWSGSPEAASPWGDSRDIDLILTTTNLSQQLPHLFPFLERPQSLLYFHPDDLAGALPPPVVRWLVAKAATRYDLIVDGPAGPRTYHRLPPVRFLPVLLGVRLSLSFPGLIAAVRLHETVGWDPARAGDAGRAYAARRLRPCWFSDGGLTSNFPVAAFDSALPTRPTFCINLSERDPDDAATPAVAMPDTNRQNMQARHIGRIDSLPSFVAAIIATIRNARENELATVPGQRDRIVTIALSPQEGGLNLGMTGDDIARLSGHGVQAATLLHQRFHPEGGGDPAAPRMNWDNHRWMRLRATLAGLEGLMVQYDRGYRHRTPGETGWPQLLRASSVRGSYDWGRRDVRETAVAQARDIADFAERLAAAPLADWGNPAITTRPAGSLFNGRRRNPDDADSLSRDHNAPLPTMRYRLIPVSGRDPRQE